MKLPKQGLYTPLINLKIKLNNYEAKTILMQLIDEPSLSFFSFLFSLLTLLFWSRTRHGCAIQCIVS